MTKKELRILRKKLPPGAITKLAKEFGHTSAYISMIFSGTRNYNPYVIARAQVLADEYQALIKQNKENAAKK